MEARLKMWKKIIQSEREKPYFQNLQEFLEQRRQETNVYPAKEDVFKAFEYTGYDDVKVVIIGQDPYHQPGQAMGLSFSVPKEMKMPPSLVNIFKELKEDCGVENNHGDLRTWAQQGVFLINMILTVEEGQPLSHQNRGWERFTEEVLKALSARKKPMVFILWGNEARSKKKLIAKHHLVIESSHPSPLGAYHSFWGSKPFSRANAFLKENGMEEIDWSNHV